MTKAWATYNTRIELALDKSLKALGLDYVDLFLVHWPLLLNPDGMLPSTRIAFKDGVCKWLTPPRQRRQIPQATRRFARRHPWLGPP